LKILFAATPEIALPLLEVLSKQHQLRVLTHPDRPQGRKKILTPSPVKVLAQNLGLEVDQPEKLGRNYRSILAPWEPDLLVSFAYGKIFGPQFLSLFPKGGINVHPSLLPRHRGPSPLSAALLAGDTKTGLTVQKLALGMDEGDILLQETWPLHGKERAWELGELAAQRAPVLVLDLLERFTEINALAQPQDPALATYCSLIQKEEGLIRWEREDALQIERKIRAYDPWPGTYTWWKGLKLNFLSAKVISPEERAPIGGRVVGVDKEKGFLIQTRVGLLALSRLQLQSKKAMDFQSFLNGNQDFVHSVLGESP